MHNNQPAKTITKTTVSMTIKQQQQQQHFNALRALASSSGDKFWFPVLAGDSAYFFNWEISFSLRRSLAWESKTIPATKSTFDKLDTNFCTELQTEFHLGPYIDELISKLNNMA